MTHPQSFREKLFRLKTVGKDFFDTELKRCLTTMDITMLGLGNMVGSGLFVLTGSVVRNTAGPGVVLSFALAGIAALLSALCFAEFGGRVPKAGSSYTYTYITIGELWAFVIGWNIILEQMIGAASNARACSGYLDSMFGHVLSNITTSLVGEIETEGLFGEYLDFVAFFIVILVSVFMGCGAKSSTNFNSVFTLISMLVIGFIIIYGFTFADFSLWTSSIYGGFLPYGFAGVLGGAGSCFYAYLGYDCIATAGEEAANPARSIPLATFTSMAIVTVAYVLASSALTLMVPYTEVNPTSAYADAFEQRGAVGAKYVVAAGALSGMVTSLVGALFALPRCVYAMASDGLIFKSLAYVHPKTQVPSLAVAVFGAATAFTALLFDLDALVEFMSIGTLLAYTIVSCSVIILRYQPSKSPPDSQENTASSMDQNSIEEEIFMENDIAGRLKPQFAILLPWTGRLEAGSLVTWAVTAFVIFTFIFLVLVRNFERLPTWCALLLCTIFCLGALVSFAVICLHQQDEEQLRFKVPFVPLIPVASVVINLVFMLNLSEMAWLRLGIWLFIGCLVYFLYGIRHSQENASPAMISPTEDNHS